MLRPVSAAKEGTVLGGKYRLLRPLASGGMGSVWLARHVDLDVDVAVKLISWVQSMKPAVVDRFKREARAAAQIRSPHVVQILDYGVHESAPYIAMELLSGEDLDTHLQRVKTVSPARAAEILGPLCKALTLAHSAGIVHRDIKPANVFLSRSGDDEIVKVVDFGIAKELQPSAQATSRTGLVGSPMYMSPEQIRSETLDARTDLWSVAVVCYEMLMGRAPFDGDNVMAVFAAVTSDDAASPSSLHATLSAFDAFFARALDRSRTARFGSARELLQDFESCVRAAGPEAFRAVPAVPTDAGDDAPTVIGGTTKRRFGITVWATGTLAVIGLVGGAYAGSRFAAETSDVEATRPFSGTANVDGALAEASDVTPASSTADPSSTRVSLASTSSAAQPLPGSASLHTAVAPRASIAPLPTGAPPKTSRPVITHSAVPASPASVKTAKDSEWGVDVSRPKP